MFLEGQVQDLPNLKGLYPAKLTLDSSQNDRKVPDCPNFLVPIAAYYRMTASDVALTSGIFSAFGGNVNFTGALLACRWFLRVCQFMKRYFSSIFIDSVPFYTDCHNYFPKEIGVGVAIGIAIETISMEFF